MTGSTTAFGCCLRDGGWNATRVAAPMRWSYDLLVDVERAVLNRSSVFSGGFDLPAAVAVSAADELDDVDVLDAIDSLVRKSLVNVEHGGDTSRYPLLETVRQFTGERLAETGEHALASRRHANYYRADTTFHWHQFFGPDQGESIAVLDREFANLRGAFRCAFDAATLTRQHRLRCSLPPLAPGGTGGGKGSAGPRRHCQWRRRRVAASADVALRRRDVGFTAGRIEDGIR